MHGILSDFVNWLQYEEDDSEQNADYYDEEEEQAEEDNPQQQEAIIQSSNGNSDENDTIPEEPDVSLDKKIEEFAKKADKSAFSAIPILTQNDNYTDAFHKFLNQINLEQ